MSRLKIFVVQIGWLILLGVVAAIFFIDRDCIPFGDSLGSVPLAVVWFGALGAVLISLTGIVEHAHDWDESFALWHLSRPLVGASLAVVGVLILQAGVLASGSSPVVTPTTPTTTTATTTTATTTTAATTTATTTAPTTTAPTTTAPTTTAPTTTAPTTTTSTTTPPATTTSTTTPPTTTPQLRPNAPTPTTTTATTTTPTTTTPATKPPATTPTTPPEMPKNLLYYLVAFLVGYREETFRELIKRLVDLIFTPATVRVAPTIAGLAPKTAPAAGGVPVKISGSGFTGTMSVMFGSNAATFHVDSDGQITAQLPACTAGPPPPPPVTVTVTVKGKTGAATASFDYT